jgi:hypothetical protein
MEYGCHSCGHKPLPGGARFCPGCGKEFDRPVPKGGSASRITTVSIESTSGGEAELIDCARCGGTGTMGFGPFRPPKTCTVCGGSGKVRV